MRPLPFRRTPLPALALCVFALASLLPQNADATSYETHIVSMDPLPCPGDGGPGCFRVSFPLDGKTMTSEVTPQDYLAGDEPGFSQGDRIVVQAEDIDGETRVFISDVVRRPALAWLLALFVAVTVLMGGLAGVRSLVGLGISFLVLFGVLIPMVLAGHPPLPVTILCGVGVMTATLLLSHGRSAKVTAALVGTGGSLLVTGILAAAFSAWASMTGIEENMLFLLGAYPDLDTRGILLSGIIIGTLGVLDDVTVSQASAVFELRGANPALTARQLTVRAMRIGRDHIAAAVNTLVLAYAGSSLPLLLLLAGGDTGESWYIILNREVIAVEILRTLVGSIGLLAAVPLTTWIAARMAVKRPPACGEHGRTGHFHAH